jgi:hypothetical protein
MCMHKCVYSQAGTAAKLRWAANSLRVVCELNANLLSYNGPSHFGALQNASSADQQADAAAARLECRQPAR